MVAEHAIHKIAEYMILLELYVTPYFASLIPQVHPDYQLSHSVRILALFPTVLFGSVGEAQPPSIRSDWLNNPAPSCLVCPAVYVLCPLTADDTLKTLVAALSPALARRCQHYSCIDHVGP